MAPHCWLCLLLVVLMLPPRLANAQGMQSCLVADMQAELDAELWMELAATARVVSRHERHGTAIPVTQAALRDLQTWLEAAEAESEVPLLERLQAEQQWIALLPRSSRESVEGLRDAVAQGTGEVVVSPELLQGMVALRFLGPDIAALLEDGAALQGIVEAAADAAGQRQRLVVEANALADLSARAGGAFGIDVACVQGQARQVEAEWKRLRERATRERADTLERIERRLKEPVERLRAEATRLQARADELLSLTAALADTRDVEVRIATPRREVELIGRIDPSVPARWEGDEVVVALELYLEIPDARFTMTSVRGTGALAGSTPVLDTSNRIALGLVVHEVALAIPDGGCTGTERCLPELSELLPTGVHARYDVDQDVLERLPDALGLPRELPVRFLGVRPEITEVGGRAGMQLYLELEIPATPGFPAERIEVSLVQPSVEGISEQVRRALEAEFQQRLCGAGGLEASLGVACNGPVQLGSSGLGIDAVVPWEGTPEGLPVRIRAHREGGRLLLDARIVDQEAVRRRLVRALSPALKDASDTLEAALLTAIPELPASDTIELLAREITVDDPELSLETLSVCGTLRPVRVSPRAWSGARLCLGQDGVQLDAHPHEIDALIREALKDAEAVGRALAEAVIDQVGAQIPDEVPLSLLGGRLTGTLRRQGSVTDGALAGTLVWRDRPGLSADVSIGWRDGKLDGKTLSVTAAPEVWDELVEALLPLPDEVGLREVKLSGGVLHATLLIELPTFERQVPAGSLSIDLFTGEVRGGLNEATLAAVIEAGLNKALADTSLTAGDLTVDLGTSPFDAEVGGGELTLVVSGITSLQGVSLPVELRLLPTLKLISPRPDDPEAVLGALVANVAALGLGELASAGGFRLHHVRCALVPDPLELYCAFDADIELWELVVGVQGFKIGTRGIDMPSGASVRVPVDVPLGYGFVLTQPGVRYTFASDQLDLLGDITWGEGTARKAVKLACELQSDWRGQAFHLLGTMVVIERFEFQKLHGTVDLRAKEITLRTRDGLWLESILSMNTEMLVKLDRPLASGTGRLTVLGTEIATANTTLEWPRASPSLRLSGKADLQIAQVELGVWAERLDPPSFGARGEVGLDIGGFELGQVEISANEHLARAGFRVLGIGLALEVPTLGGITEDALLDLIGSLLDLSPEKVLKALESILSGDVTIKLGSVGEGDGSFTSAESGAPGTPGGAPIGAGDAAVGSDGQVGSRSDGMQSAVDRPGTVAGGGSANGDREREGQPNPNPNPNPSDRGGQSGSEEPADTSSEAEDDAQENGGSENEVSGFDKLGTALTLVPAQGGYDICYASNPSTCLSWVTRSTGDALRSTDEQLYFLGQVLDGERNGRPERIRGESFQYVYPSGPGEERYRVLKDPKPEDILGNVDVNWSLAVSDAGLFVVPRLRASRHWTDGRLPILTPTVRLVRQLSKPGEIRSFFKDVSPHHVHVYCAGGAQKAFPGVPKRSEISGALDELDCNEVWVRACTETLREAEWLDADGKSVNPDKAARRWLDDAKLELEGWKVIFPDTVTDGASLIAWMKAGNKLGASQRLQLREAMAAVLRGEKPVFQPAWRACPGNSPCPGLSISRRPELVVLETVSAGPDPVRRVSFLPTDDSGVVRFQDDGIRRAFAVDQLGVPPSGPTRFELVLRWRLLADGAADARWRFGESPSDPLVLTARRRPDWPGAPVFQPVERDGWSDPSEHWIVFPPSPSAPIRVLPLWRTPAARDELADPEDPEVPLSRRQSGDHEPFERALLTHLLELDPSLEAHVAIDEIEGRRMALVRTEDQVWLIGEGDDGVERLEGPDEQRFLANWASFERCLALSAFRQILPDVEEDPLGPGETRALMTLMSAEDWERLSRSNPVALFRSDLTNACWND